ncbi:InlB B-repeat-containing protein, partial [Candidatus Bathycorpusculum sp.]|uniref:InlB B-repeat-containing protein n=1 Tax=Candidatus Bathycorpusculum sp. TaxID=2994959 RepID=UPI002827A14D|nr:InlB B-repeat-containing protein [Candidatus Termitimicrobium sp.]MCL2431997.1 InlB B-repeat-containing protein [Candidatus Termitimicrobium sp.]
VLRAVWHSVVGPVVYNITYVLEGGVNAIGNPSVYVVDDLPLSITDPTRDGYDFLGWIVEYADGTTTGPVSGFSVPTRTTGNIVLTAHWTKISGIQYTVTYNGNGHTGGNVPIDNNSPYLSENKVTVLGQGTLSRSGYTFLGWSTIPNSSTATYTVGSTFTIVADTILYAVWRQTASPSYYTVTYQPGAHGTFTAQTTQNLAYGAPTPVAPKVTGESGWKFARWSPVPSATVTGNVVYVAQWVPEQITLLTVQFVDWNGLLIKSQTVPYGGDAIAPNDPTREGYTFTGWDLNYNNVTSNLTVTAQYTANSEPPTLQTWALANLLLSIAGIILAVVATVYVLLQQKKQRAKSISDNDPMEIEQSNQHSKQERLCRNLCLIIALALCIIGVVVFLLTEDMSLQMGWVDGWSIVNVAILLVELLCLFFVFKPKKKSHEQENENKPDSTN